MKRIRNNEGFTLIELLIVVAIIGIIAAIAIPGLLRARQSGNEASAIGSVRALSSANATYAASCGGGGYASTLLALATEPVGGVPFISPDLETADVAPGKSGFLVSVLDGPAATTQNVLAAADTCNNAATPSRTNFTAIATPITVGTTGQRSFGTDARGTILQNRLGVAFTAATVAAGPVGGDITALQ